MKKTAWIWLAGMFAWLLDAFVDLRYHAPQHAALAFLLAALFAIAWLFYRQSPR